MANIKFIMVGGFLGAGKTTAIGRLARHYTEQGLKVGLVTNDQANGLVDTQSLRAQGFLVGEVPGACFCCKFDDLVSTVKALETEHHPDVVITEPVGSCTDLVATVIEPLRKFHQGDFEVAPLAVLLKPEHGLKILGDEQSGFSPQAAYIFLKQIEEADVVAINKIDKLTPEQQEMLRDQVARRYPNKEIVLVSGTRGDGFDTLVELFKKPRPSSVPMMEVDYEKYAEGEAELGWLNATYEVSAQHDDILMNDVIVTLLQKIRASLLEGGAEPAHLKVLCQTGEQFGVANLVGSDVDVELSVASDAKISTAELFVNARAAVAPEQLESAVQDSIAALGQEKGLNFTQQKLQRFSPAPPVPTHRFASS